MISMLLSNEHIDCKSAIYVGDCFEDYISAKFNGLQFILVDWGYGELSKNCKQDFLHIGDPSELLDILQGVS
jgi:phosphoglycolate phosphatase-like HAD superfamily hydrolase